MTETVLSAYDLNNNVSIVPFGDGLINDTWKIIDGNKSFILQKINTAVFKKPELISENIADVADYLAIHYPDYFFPALCKTADGKDMVYVEGEGHFRMFPFIENSHTVNVAENTDQAYEASKKFGEFTRLLAAFPAKNLKITLPDFHNLSLRYTQFLQAQSHGNKERIEQAKELIQYLDAQKNIVEEYERIKASPQFKLRVTHHDTKINNVLFDIDEKGICVIDLDTLMPGYFISDVGDMIRTYISPANEEEKDFSKIKIREDYFAAIANGYLSEMKDELTAEELHHFVFAGKFMVYMQALRFLTDYLNDDVYYGRAYEEHNLMRAGNQAQLLKLLIKDEKKLASIVFDTVYNKAN
ncbi:MAG: phosphotransferase enzyme family protein [Ilyomonas sp.]